ncbi:hypothetical protein [Ligilactobacillus animalis]|uniref:hypothetical protein n=1 Tax=Ligilactobacillus animalis TaxID=1605 RepID=UPI002902F7F6|nr:hypothetical protein [Ligilactobacillus animalis]MDU1487947.1 hypothetical protein [Ligilactobacillus animalis]
MIRNNGLEDYNQFKTFSSKQPTMTEGNHESTFKELYLNHYFLYNLLSQYENSSSDLRRFSSIAKRDLISALDLINMNHFESAYKDYRSFIESCLRIVAATFRGYVIDQRHSKGIYSSSTQLKKIRSLIDTNSVGKFTSWIIEAFSNSIINEDLLQINKLYSYFSGYVHTNNISHTVSSDLASLTTHSSDTTLGVLNNIKKLIAFCTSIIYFSTRLSLTYKLGQQDFYFMVSFLKDFIPEEHIIDINNSPTTGLYVDFDDK